MQNLLFIKFNLTFLATVCTKMKSSGRIQSFDGLLILYKIKLQKETAAMARKNVMQKEWENILESGNLRKKLRVRHSQSAQYLKLS